VGVKGHGSDKFLVKAAVDTADLERVRSIRPLGSFWRDAMLLIVVGRRAIAGLS